MCKLSKDISKVEAFCKSELENFNLKQFVFAFIGCAYDEYPYNKNEILENG